MVIYHPAPKLSAVAYPSRRKILAAQYWVWLRNTEAALLDFSKDDSGLRWGSSLSTSYLRTAPGLNHFGKRQMSKTRWGLNLTWDRSARCCMLFGFTVPNQVFDDFCCIIFSHAKCFGPGGTQPFDKDGYLLIWIYSYLQIYWHKYNMYYIISRCV